MTAPGRGQDHPDLLAQLGKLSGGKRWKRGFQHTFFGKRGQYLSDTQGYRANDCIEGLGKAFNLGQFHGVDFALKKLRQSPQALPTGAGFRPHQVIIFATGDRRRPG